MENSNCQSLGLFFRAAAYDGLGGEAFEPEADGPGAELGFGVATRVPSGVCATILDPSKKNQHPNQTSYSQDIPSTTDNVTVFSAAPSSS